MLTRAAVTGVALAVLCAGQALAATERGKAHVLVPRSGISVSVEVVYADREPGSAHSGAPTTSVAALPGDSGATLAPVLTTSATNGFSNGPSFDRAPCLRRRVGGSWGGTLSFCVAAPARSAPRPRVAVSPETVARVLADRARALAPRPRINVAPGRHGVTGLDSYFWTERASPISASAGVGGLIVTAQAHPVQYVWDFGDGRDLVTVHPGRPWTRPAPGDIAHTYQSRGRYRVALEQIWEARWRVGTGAWESLGFFSSSAARRYPVREVVPVLVPTR